MRDPGRSWTARLLSLLIALQGWTVASLALLILDPGGVPARLDCARRISPLTSCLEAQAVVTDAWRMLHYWPLMGTVVLGYLAIVLVFLRGVRGSRGVSRGPTRARRPSRASHVSRRRPAVPAPHRSASRR